MGLKKPSTGPRYGVAYGAEIHAGKVLSNAGSGSDSQILGAGSTGPSRTNASWSRCRWAARPLRASRTRGCTRPSPRAPCAPGSSPRLERERPPRPDRSTATAGRWTSRAPASACTAHDAAAPARAPLLRRRGGRSGAGALNHPERPEGSSVEVSVLVAGEHLAAIDGVPVPSRVPAYGSARSWGPSV